MEEILTKLIENTPVLAVLAFYLLYSMRIQERRDISIAEERKQFIIAYQNIADALKQVSVDIKTHSEFVQISMVGIGQMHEYQKKEHEQMIRSLEKINGKS